jgi:hypothetical protein
VRKGEDFGEMPRFLVRCQEKGTFGEMKVEDFGEMPRFEIIRRTFF